VYFRIAALAALSLTALFAQSTELRPDESDLMVRRAKENVEQVTKMISLGALPATRLKRAQEELQDALDMSLLRSNLYSNDLLPEQMDQLVRVAQTMVLRRQRSIAETQQLVDTGVISRVEAEASSGDLQRAQSELEAAQARARLIEQIAESVRIEKRTASLELEAESHPEWAGKVYMKYPGNGAFTHADLLTVETAYTAKFSKSLPISADGETAVHRSLGFDHRGRVDVALNPDQPEGLWLLKYLESKHIPYFAFRMAVAHMATGAHIHLGPESSKLAATE
jgi:hypothetical protein